MTSFQGKQQVPGWYRRSPAEWYGAASLVAALVLAVFVPAIAALPLVVFVLFCAVLPFFPTISFFFPVISRGRSGRPEVSLTFDDGPDPETTPRLLALLRRHRITATFFVTGDRAYRYPDLIKRILAEGHGIGNHSYTHDDFIMFRIDATLEREIGMTQAVLAMSGVRPLLFRPPVGIVTPRYADALHRSGMIAVTFSCRGHDMGNRRVAGLADRILAKVRAGDIILLHDVLPRTSGVDRWLEQVDLVIQGVKQRRLFPVALERLLGRPVMLCIPATDDVSHRGLAAEGSTNFSVGTK